MTSTPTAPRLRMQFKVRTPEFDESEHPRDRKGRFIETGAEVRIWGGGSGTVVANVGGGRIEVQKADGTKVVVHRNYLTVTARPNGEAPTENEAEVDAAPVQQASADAVEDPALVDGETEVLPERGDAPDRLVEAVTPGEQVGDYTVGEYVDGPSTIDGWVVGVTDSGGPIVRTEAGQDWPLLPDAQIARETEGAPEMPGDLVDPAPVAAEPSGVVPTAPGAPVAEEDPNLFAAREWIAGALARARNSNMRGDGVNRLATANAWINEDDPESHNAAVRMYADLDTTGWDAAEVESHRQISGQLRERFPDAFAEPAVTEEPPVGAPVEEAPATEAAPEGEMLDSLNPSGNQGVFADYASGREFRANAPLAPNLTTLAETEGVESTDEVTVYRGVPDGETADSGIQPGDFVTTNRQLAQDYAGTGEVIEETVTYGDVLDDRDEPGGEEYIYRPAAQAPERQADEVPPPAGEPEAAAPVAPRYEGSATHEAAPLRGAATQDPMLTDPDSPEFAERFGDAVKYVDVDGQKYRLLHDDLSVYVSAEQPNGRYKVVGYLSTYSNGETSGTYVEGAERRKGLGTQMRDFMRERGQLVRHSSAISTEGAALANSDPDDPDFPSEEARAAAVEAGLDPDRALVQRYGNGFRMWYAAESVQPGDRVSTYTSGGRVWIGQSSVPGVEVEMREVSTVETLRGRPTATFTDGSSASLGTKPVIVEDEFIPGAPAAVDEPAAPARPDAVITNPRQQPVSAREALQGQDDQTLTSMAADGNLRQQDRDAAREELDRRNASVGTEADRAYEVLSQSPDAEDMGEQGVRDLIARRLRETEGEPFTDVVVGDSGVRVFREEGRVEPFNVEDLAGGDETLPDNLRPRAEAEVAPVPESRQRLVAALQAGMEAEGVDDAQRRRLQGVVDMVSGDAVPDETAEVVLESLAAQDSPQGRAIRAALDGALPSDEPAPDTVRRNPDELVPGDVWVDGGGDQWTIVSRDSEDDSGINFTVSRDGVTNTTRMTRNDRLDVIPAPTPPAGPQEVQQTPNGQYSVGQTVEVLGRDFSAPGMPEVWQRGTVDRIVHDEPSGLADVFVTGEDGERLATQRVGPRGGNGKIRPAVEPEEQATIQTPRPGVEEPPIPTDEQIATLTDQELHDLIASVDAAFEQNGSVSDEWQDRWNDLTDEERRRDYQMTEWSTVIDRAEIAALDPETRRQRIERLRFVLDNLTDSDEDEARRNGVQSVLNDYEQIDAATPRPDERQGALGVGDDVAAWEVSVGQRVTVNGITGEVTLHERRGVSSTRMVIATDDGTTENVEVPNATRVLLVPEAQAQPDAPETPAEPFDARTFGREHLGQIITVTDEDGNTTTGYLMQAQATRWDMANLDGGTTEVRPRTLVSAEVTTRTERVPVRRISAGDEVIGGRLGLRTVADVRNLSTTRVQINFTDGTNMRVSSRGNLDRVAVEGAPETPGVPEDDAPIDDPTLLPRRRFGAFEDAEAEGYVFDEADASQFTVGDLVVVRSRGSLREARVAAIGRTRITVEYTTDGAVTEQRRVREYHAGRNPESERRQAETRARQNWDYNQRNSSEDTYSIPEWVTKPEGSHSFAGHVVRHPDGTSTRLYGEEARTAYLAEESTQREIARAREFIATYPDRDAYATEAGQDMFESVTVLRDAARASGPRDDVRNAHITTFTQRSTAFGRRPASAQPDAPEPGPDQIRVGDIEGEVRVVLGGRTARITDVAFNDADTRMIRVTFEDDGTSERLPFGVDAVLPLAPEPGADQPEDAPEPGTPAAYLAQVLADETISDAQRQLRATFLADSPTFVYRGAVIHRHPGGDREWVLTSPDGFKRITTARTRDEARDLLDAIAGYPDADGNEFDWASPGVQARIGEFRSANNEPIGVVMQRARARVPVSRRRGADWEPPVMPYGTDLSRLDNDSIDPARNPSAQARRDAAHKMFTFAHEQSGWRTVFTRTHTHSGDGFILSGKIVDRDGNQVGDVTRSVFRNGLGEMEAHHDLLTIHSQYQGQGFADAYYKHLYDAYERQGVQVVTIQANIDVGGYAWARRGFEFDPSYHRNGKSAYDNSMRSRMDSALSDALYTRQGQFTDEQVARIEEFRTDLRNGRVFTPAEMANALSDIRWTETTRRGLTVEMWPGKKALLGTNWYGKFRVKAQAEQPGTPGTPGQPGTPPEPDRPTLTVPTTDLATMTDQQLADEARDNAEALTRAVNDERRPASDEDTAAMVARQGALAVERNRRIAVASQSLIPSGENVAYTDLRVGDTVVVPFVTERTPQLATIESISDAGMTTIRVRYDDNTIGTVYVPSESSIAEAQWRRGFPANPTVPARDLKVGDAITLDGGDTGAVEAIERLDSGLYNLSLRLDDGTLLDFEVVPGYGVVRTSSFEETHVAPGDLTDDELTAELLDLNRRYRVGPDFTAQRAIRRQMLTEEFEKRQTATVPVRPLRDDAGSARPRLYTYQRQAINGLNIDGARSEANETAQQAAARVRARLPLSADQSRALAEEIRRLAVADATLGIRQQRSRERLAQAFDVSAAVASGRGDYTTQPWQDGVTRVKPSGLTSGDTAVIRDSDGLLHVVKVHAVQTMMRGTLVRMTYEREDGTVEQRLVDRDVDTWLVPDLPEPKAVTPQVGRELARASDVVAGDLISIERNGNHEEMRVGTRTVDADGNHVFTMERVDDLDTNPPSITVSTGALVHRLERGVGSADQPVLLAFSENANSAVVTGSDVRVGDLISSERPAVRGTVLRITEVEERDGVPAHHALVVLDESGDVKPLMLYANSAGVTRWATAAGNVTDAVAAEFDDQRERGLRSTLTGWLDAVQRRGSTMAGYLSEDWDNPDVELKYDDLLSRVRFAIDGNDNDFQNTMTSKRMWEHVAADLGLSEDDPVGRQAMLDAVRQMATDTYRRLDDSLRNGTVLPNETALDAVGRVLRQWRDEPPKRDTAAIVEALLPTLPNFRGGQRDEARALPDLAEGTFESRMETYRSMIGTFGHEQQTRASYANLDFDALERGEVPEQVEETTLVRPRAADGGPAEVAMRDLATVKAAGAEVSDKVDNRAADLVRANLRAPEGMDPIRDGESVDAYYRRVSEHLDRLSAERQRAHDAAMQRRAEVWDAVAMERGWDDWEALRQAYFRNSSTNPDAVKVRDDFFAVRESEKDDEFYASMFEEYERLRDEHHAGQQIARSNALVQNTSYRQAAIEVLSGLRSVGGSRLDYQQADAVRARRTAVRGDGRPLGERDRHVVAMRQAEDALPTEWVDAIRDYVKTTYNRERIGIGPLTRGHADYRGNIRLSESEPRYDGDNGRGRVAVHELAHFAQRAVPGLMAAEEAFLWSRTSSGEVGSRSRESLRNLRGHGGDSSQFGYFDEFPSPYSGVDYSRSQGRQGTEAWEVLTTGVESIFAGSQYLDEDYRKFILGTLALL